MTDKNEEWIKDFVACLNVASGKDLQIQKSFEIKNKNLPERLYKFRGVSDFSLDNLTNGTVWLNSPTEYNDPYDSAGSISVEEVLKSVRIDQFSDLVAHPQTIKYVTEEQIAEARISPEPYKTLTRMLLESDPNFPRDGIDIVINYNEERMNSFIRPGLDQIINTVRAGMKICSFSATKDPIVMWSHYADNHRGFCMEYDISSINDFSRRMLFPVIYQNDMFDTTKYLVEAICNKGTFNNLFGSLQILYKSPEWSYEKEWRLAYIAGVIAKEQNVPFARPNRVYMGARMSDENRQKIIQICKSKGVKLFQMSLVPNRFELQAESVNL